MFNQIKMKVADAIELYKGLDAVKKHKGARFSVIIARNVKELEHVLREYENVAQPSDEFIALSNEAHKLAEAEDAEGIKKLEEENADLIDARKAQLKKLDKAMEKLVEINLQTIKEAQLPEDVTPEEIVPLLPILA
jgi:microcompartment protein CcmL/EutN